MDRDIYFMRQALNEATKAAAIDEVPVGAVIVNNGKIISYGYNRKETDCDATLHAEMIAIRAACRALNSWRLLGCAIYVTLEPCAMCTGAMIQARIARLVYAASDPKTGAAGSVLNLACFRSFNHQMQVSAGILAEESSMLLQDFFRKKRMK